MVGSGVGRKSAAPSALQTSARPSCCGPSGYRNRRVAHKPLDTARRSCSCYVRVHRAPRTFSLIIAGLCRAAASRIAVDRSAGPLLVRIFTRLHRLAARLTSLVSRIQAGTLPPPGPRRPAARSRDQRRARLPDSRGWLLREVPGAAEYAGQVQALLADPQTAALLEAAPQAGRIFRPLCRMLAIPLPDHLRRLRPPTAPRPTAADTADPPADSPPAGPCTPPRCAALAETGLPPLPD